MQTLSDDSIKGIIYQGSVLKLIRLFETNKVRIGQELEGDWDFQPIGTEDEIPAFITIGFQCLDAGKCTRNCLTYQGKGAYRRIVEVDSHSCGSAMF